MCIWRWPSGFGEEDFDWVDNVLRRIRNNGREDFEIEISIKYFCYYLFMKIGMVQPLIELNHLYPRVLCANLSNGSGDLQCILPISQLVSFGEYVAFILTNFNPLYPRMMCAKCCWNCLIGSREFHQCIFAISLLSTLGNQKDRDGLYLNKQEIPSSKNAFCSVWLKVAQV